MMRLEADEDDLQHLTDLFTDRLTGFQITEGAQIAFDWHKPNVSVKANIAKASDTSLDVDFTLGAGWRFLNWIACVASWGNWDFANILAAKCPGIVHRKTRSSISFNVPALCEKLNIPLTVSVADVSLQNRQLTLALKLE